MNILKETIYNFETCEPTKCTIINLFQTYIFSDISEKNDKINYMQRFSMLFDGCGLEGINDLIYLILDFCMETNKITIELRNWVDNVNSGFCTETIITDTMFRYVIYVSFDDTRLVPRTDRSIRRFSIQIDQSEGPYVYYLPYWRNGRNESEGKCFSPMLINKLLSIKNLKARFKFRTQHENICGYNIIPPERNSFNMSDIPVSNINDFYVFKENIFLDANILFVLKNDAIVESFKMFIDIFEYLFDDSFYEGNSNPWAVYMKMRREELNNKI